MKFEDFIKIINENPNKTILFKGLKVIVGRYDGNNLPRIIPEESLNVFFNKEANIYIIEEKMKTQNLTLEELKSKFKNEYLETFDKYSII